MLPNTQNIRRLIVYGHEKRGNYPIQGQFDFNQLGVFIVIISEIASFHFIFLLEFKIQSVYQTNNPTCDLKSVTFTTQLAEGYIKFFIQLDVLVIISKIASFHFIFQFEFKIQSVYQTNNPTCDLKSVTFTIQLSRKFPFQRLRLSAS